MDFWIPEWISGFQIGFLDFRLDFWISQRISGFHSGFLDFSLDFWISADGVRDFFRDGPLVAEAVATSQCTPLSRLMHVVQQSWQCCQLDVANNQSNVSMTGQACHAPGRRKDF